MIEETRKIGEIDVSLAGLGCNNFGRRVDEAKTQEVVDAALEADVTLFDTADIYGGGLSEEFLGRALGLRRVDAVIVTKFGMAPPDGLNAGHPDAVAKSCDASLKRLGTDRIDVYLIHRPDTATPIGDTLAAMNDLIDRGKVREIGCSNFAPELLDEAAVVAEKESLRGFVTVQNEYSLVNREPEKGVLDACRRLGMSFMPYFPLASGLLTGKYRKGQPAPAGTRLGGDGSQLAEQVVDENRLAVAERLAEFAQSRGHTLLELALSWLASQRAVATVIAGATSPEQVRANVAATTAWQLTDEELKEIDELTG
jgi:aryl-alcohol dehydrogenase-like predicted oxidoreductase